MDILPYTEDPQPRYERGPSNAVAVVRDIAPVGNRHDTIETLFRLAEAYRINENPGKTKECLDRIFAAVPLNVRVDPPK